MIADVKESDFVVVVKTSSNVSQTNCGVSLCYKSSSQATNTSKDYTFDNSIDLSLGATSDVLDTTDSLGAANYIKLWFSEDVVKNVQGTVVVYKKVHENKIGLKDKLPETNKIELILENGVFDGSGSNVVGDGVRTQWIDVNKGHNVLILIPSGYWFAANLSFDGSKQQNTPKTHHSMLIKNVTSKKIRVCYGKISGEKLSVNSLSNTDKQGIEVYEFYNTSDDYDIIVSSNNSSLIDKLKSDIICDSSNDTRVLSALFGSAQNIRAKIMSGDYFITEKHLTRETEQCCSLQTNEELSAKNIRIEGCFGTIFHISENLYNSINDDTYSVILCPRISKDVQSSTLSNTKIELSYITIFGVGYTKPICYFDLTMSDETSIIHCTIEGNKSHYYGETFETKPNARCIGFKVGHGSNNGIHNYLKHNWVHHCYIGFECSGEHYVFEDCLSHHCYYGFAFGYTPTREGFEHPNVMTGCSIEGCYQLMLLTKQGELNEMTFKERRDISPAFNIIQSTLICVGLSTETAWHVPLDEVKKGESDIVDTKPIKEVIKGAYRGTLCVDYIPDKPVFEEGSGLLFEWTNYTWKQILKGFGSVIEKKIQIP